MSDNIQYVNSMRGCARRVPIDVASSVKRVQSLNRVPGGWLGMGWPVPIAVAYTEPVRFSVKVVRVSNFWGDGKRRIRV